MATVAPHQQYCSGHRSLSCIIRRVALLPDPTQILIFFANALRLLWPGSGSPSAGKLSRAPDYSLPPSFSPWADVKSSLVTAVTLTSGPHIFGCSCLRQRSQRDETSRLLCHTRGQLGRRILCKRSREQGHRRWLLPCALVTWEQIRWRSESMPPHLPRPCK